MDPLSILNRSKYLSLVMVALLGSAVLSVERGSATDTPSIEETSSPVCQLLAQLFRRSVRSYEHDFGPVQSSHEQTFGYPSPGFPAGYSGKRVHAQLSRQVVVSYFVITGSPRGEIISGVEAQGEEALRKLGLNVHSLDDVQRLLGPPDYLYKKYAENDERKYFPQYPHDELGQKPIGYICDRLPGDEKIDPPNTSSIGIDPVMQLIYVSFHWAYSYR